MIQNILVLFFVLYVCGYPVYYMYFLFLFQAPEISTLTEDLLFLLGANVYTSQSMALICRDVWCFPLILKNVLFYRSDLYILPQYNMALKFWTSTFSLCLYQNRSPPAGKRENWQFVDLSRLQFTSDESEFIPDYI